MRTSDEPISAAVLVPVYTRGAEKGVILTQRAANLTTHAGQVAFPGGRYDPSRDASLLGTALRETFEEIGLREKDIEVIGALPEHRTLSSNYIVSPFVARVSESLSLHLDHREVQSTFDVSLRVFGAPERRERFVWKQGGQSYDVPFVSLGGSRVWGITLEIIDDLLLELEGLLAA